MNHKPLRLALPAFLFALVLFLAACGSSDDSSDDGTTESGPDPIALAPSDAPVYANVVVRPEGSLGDDLKSAISKISGIEDPGQGIISAINDSLAEDTDLTYEDDIEPWLGSRAGVFVSGFQVDTMQPDAAAVIATTDPGAAQSFVDASLEQQGDSTTDESYNGVDYKIDDEDAAIGVDQDFLIVGTEQGFKDAVDAGAGDSLADNSDATAALAEAPDDSVFSVYADGTAIANLIKSSPGLSGAESKQLDQALDQIPDGPIEAWGTVTDSTFAIAGSSPTPKDAPAASDLITTFPGDSWLAFAGSDVGKQLDASLQSFQEGFQAGFESSAGQLPPGFSAASVDPIAEIEKATGLDLEKDLSWVGDAGAFFEGTSPLGIGVGAVLESNDDADAQATIKKLQTALEKNPSVKKQAQIAPNSDGDGFTISAPPFTAEVAVRDGKAVIAGGGENVDSVLNPDETLADSDRFTTATGNLADGATPTFFLDMPSLVQLIESQGQSTEDPDYAMAAPYLHAIDYVVAGSGTDGDRTSASFVLGVKESDSSGGTDVAPAVITP